MKIEALFIYLLLFEISLKCKLIISLLNIFEAEHKTICIYDRESDKAKGYKGVFGNIKNKLLFSDLEYFYLFEHFNL